MWCSSLVITKTGEIVGTRFDGHRRFASKLAEFLIFLEATPSLVAVSYFRNRAVWHLASMKIYVISIFVDDQRKALVADGIPAN